MTSFDEHERKRIEDNLVEAGRETFATFGYDRTRIKDLTDEVGIATSTFYQFFDSKAALYLEILRRERDRIIEETEALLEDAPDLESEVRTGLEYFFEELETNPLYYDLVVENEIETLHLQLSDEEIADFYREQYTTYEPYVRNWTSREAFRIDDPSVTIWLFRLLSFAAVAKENFEDVSDEELAAAEEALIATLVDGLVSKDP